MRGHILATEGTCRYLAEHGVDSAHVKKLHEGRPNVADVIKNRDVQLIVNTPIGRSSKHDDSYIRKTAIQMKIPYITSMAAAEASVEGIEEIRKQAVEPVCLQDYNSMR